jgi:hypothetical protein
VPGSRAWPDLEEVVPPALDHTKICFLPTDGGVTLDELSDGIAELKAAASTLRE